MSAETLLLVIAGAVSALITGLTVAWFTHRLSVNEAAALRRAQDIRNDTKDIKERIEAQAESNGRTRELLAILKDRLDDRSDRLTIVESGHSTVVTTLEVLRADLHNHIEWTREQIKLAQRAG